MEKHFETVFEEKNNKKKATATATTEQQQQPSHFIPSVFLFIVFLKLNSKYFQQDLIILFILFIPIPRKVKYLPRYDSIYSLVVSKLEQKTVGWHTLESETVTVWFSITSKKKFIFPQLAVPKCWYKLKLRSNFRQDQFICKVWSHKEDCGTSFIFLSGLWTYKNL